MSKRLVPFVTVPENKKTPNAHIPVIHNFSDDKSDAKSDAKSDKSAEINAIDVLLRLKTPRLKTPTKKGGYILSKRTRSRSKSRSRRTRSKRRVSRAKTTKNLNKYDWAKN